MKPFDKEGNINLSVVAGTLHEVAVRSAYAELSKITDGNIDYYKIEIQLKLSALSTESFTPLRTVTVSGQEHQ